MIDIVCGNCGCMVFALVWDMQQLRAICHDCESVITFRRDSFEETA